jgi:hypothetical protein
MTTNTEATKAGDLLDRMANVLRTAKQHIGHGADPRTPQAKAYWAADAMLAEYDAFRRRATSLAEPALPASDAKIIHGKNCDCQNKIACEDAEERELHGTIRGKPIEPADPSILAHNLRSIADAINPDTNPPNPKSRWWNTRDAVNRLNQIADELDASSVEPASAAEGAFSPSDCITKCGSGEPCDQSRCPLPDPAQSADTPSEAPVAWQRRCDGGEWLQCSREQYEHTVRRGNAGVVGDNAEARALYASRPQPARDGATS